jgi:hypothetical protein
VAIVYLTGRSVSGNPAVGEVLGTIEETAAVVTNRGGVGIPVRCDHRDDAAVAGSRLSPYARIPLTTLPKTSVSR